MDKQGTNKGTQQKPKVAAQPPAMAGPAKKISLDEVLNSTNFGAYQMASSLVKNYERLGDHPSFNPNLVGAGLYKALQEFQAEISNKDEKLEVGLLLDALQKNLQNNTLTKKSFEDTLEHVKSFLGPYVNKVKGGLEEGHYRTMAMRALQDKEMYGSLYAKIAAHPTAQRAAQLGGLFKEIGEQAKKGDVSTLSTYYQKLASPKTLDDHIKSGKTPEEAKTIVDSGKKAYESLVGTLGEDMKAAHQQYIQKLVGNGFYKETQKIDVGHLKTTISGAAPHDILTLMPYGSRGEASE